MTKNLTRWFPANVKPVHVGVYETTAEHLGEGYSLWNGRKWLNQQPKPRSAKDEPGNLKHAEQRKKWRGLAEQPK